MYNIDKTRFRIRVITSRIIIIYLSTKAIYLVDPNNQELIIVVEIICSNSLIISPMFILKGNILLEKYFENDLKNNILLTMSLIGYTKEYLAIKYLIYFYNYMFKKTKG